MAFSELCSLGHILDYLAVEANIQEANLTTPLGEKLKFVSCKAVQNSQLNVLLAAQFSPVQGQQPFPKSKRDANNQSFFATHFPRIITYH